MSAVENEETLPLVEEEVAPAEEDVAVFVDEKRVTLNIISVVQSTRTQNGLRHSLYQRYRHYCNRRLLRLRRTLNVKQVGHGGKAARRFNRNQINVAHVKDARYLMIPLMEAERSWSYGMELRENFEADESHRTRNHAIRKLARAATSAEHLLNLCRARGDGRTALEAEAYYLQLKGFWLMERKDYAQALGCYPQAKLIFEQLSHVVVDGDEQKTIQGRLEEIETAIKFCESRKHLSRSAEEELEGEDSPEPEKELQEKLEKMLLEEQTKTSESLAELNWKSSMVPVPAGKIRVGFVDIRSILDQIRKEKNLGSLFTVYDALFVKFNDVLDAIRDAQKQIEKGNVKSFKTSARHKNLELLTEYCRYHRLFHTFNRNTLLLHGSRVRYHYPDAPFGAPELAEKIPSNSWELFCGISAGGLQSKRIQPEELVKLCDNILANLKEIEGLCDDEEEDRKKYAALVLYYAALRCYYVALSFLRNERFPETQALLNRTEEHARSASDHFDVCKTKAKNDLLSLEALLNQIRVEKCLLKARFITSLKKTGAKEKEKEEEGVEEESKEERAFGTVGEFSLWDYPETTEDKVFPFPPDFQGFHCNPLLFDLAMDEVVPPSLESRKTPAKRGLFGWW